MFQKTVIDRYLSQQDKELVAARYEAFRQRFADPDKQANIRASKEEQYQEGFIRDLFCAVLGYTIKPEPGYNILTELKNETENKNNARKADGAIVLNGSTKAVIELKGTDTQDLDKVAKQAFDYKSHHENCPYVIVSNFERLRLYVETQIAFEEFNLFSLTEDRFALLYLLLSLPSVTADIPLKLKRETASDEKEITDKFYADYSAFKRELFDDLVANNPATDKLLLFKKTQKLLDRILFILFAEDRGLLPANSSLGILHDWKTLQKMGYGQPLYEFFKNFFRRIDTGYVNEDDHTKDVFAYNGGLFKADDLLDGIKIGDEVLASHTAHLASYDFASTISVDILGRIFENSLTEIEEVQGTLQAGAGEGSPSLQTPGAFSATPSAGLPPRNAPKDVSKRKKDGVFYTPEYITQYIVENTVGTLCADKRAEMGINDEAYAAALPAGSGARGKTQKAEAAARRAELDARLQDYREWLLSLKILDPACGSGAFLNAALKRLRTEHGLVEKYWMMLHPGELYFDNIDNAILENNLFGVDINEDSTEIARLSLWLSTAKKNRKLSTLAGNIKCGNSLIADPSVAGDKAFDWEKEFPQAFAQGGFDVVIGNPPYVQLQSMGGMSDVYAKCGYESYNKSADLYCLFAERGYKLLKKGGLLSFIMPNKWMLVDYGKELRRFLSHTALRQIINFGDVQFFKDATTYVCIFVAQNAEKKDKPLALSLNRKSYHGDFLAEVQKGLQKHDIAEFGENEWSIQDTGHKTVLAKMAGHKPLKEFPVEINYGIKTGYNDAFFIDGETRQKLIAEDAKSAELIQPLFRGRDITAWTTQNQDLYLINPHNGNKEQGIPPVNIEDYPAVKKHLDQFIDKLSKRGDKGETLYNLRNCAYLDEFAKPKITYPNMTTVFPFCYDESGSVCNDKAFIITGGNDGKLLKALTAIFNSRLAKLWIWYNCPELQGGTREIRKAYFENFPVPDITDGRNAEAAAHLSALADRMLALQADMQKKRGKFLGRVRERFGIVRLCTALDSFWELDFAGFVKELAKSKARLSLKDEDEWEEYFNSYKSDLTALHDEIARTDAEINALVYKLYGLTLEEIGTVEEK